MSEKEASGEPPRPDAEDLRVGVYGYIIAHAASHRLRTGATIAAVAVAVAFLILVTSLSVGLESATQRELLDYTLGTPELPISDFIQTEEGDFIGLFAPRLLDPSDVDAITIQAQVELGSAQDVSVYPYTERLLGMVHVSGGLHQYRRLIAVDPDLGLETAYTSYHAYHGFALGEPLNASDGAEVVLGYNLWEERFPEARVGDLVSLAPEGASWFEANVTELRSGGPIHLSSLASVDGLRLVGVLDHDPSTDNNAFVPLGHLSQLTGAGATLDGPRCEATSVVVRRPGVDVEALALTLLGEAPRVSSYYVTRIGGAWNDQVSEGLRSSIYGWLLLAVSVILVAMVLGVSNTVLLSVTQRRRELGTLRALGLSREQVQRLVVYEALFLAMMGWVIGFFAGHILTSSVLGDLFEGAGVALSTGRTVPSIALGSVVAVILAALVGSALPARRTASMSPTEALSGP